MIKAKRKLIRPIHDAVRRNRRLSNDAGFDNAREVALGPIQKSWSTLRIRIRITKISL
ncbi:MAG TPA: hypothetical protein VHT73_17640 [Thermodesulfobacteriota bacterium]|nr:hypothetical protein [Thermodesulfobacteriota bacterium]